LLLKDKDYEYKIWKYSLSSYHKNNNCGNYYCSDTVCTAWGIYKFIIDDNIHEYNKINENEEYFNLTKKHSKEYNMHNYIKYEIMLKEINLDDKNVIIPKLSDYNYLSEFEKVFV